MSRLCALVIFLVCIGWIAASIFVTGYRGHELASWDWVAVIGAAISFFGAVVDD